MFSMGDKVKFISHEDGAWGEEYGGQVGIVVGIESYLNGEQSIEVRFDDGQVLGVVEYELERVE